MQVVGGALVLAAVILAETGRSAAPAAGVAEQPTTRNAELPEPSEQPTCAAPDRVTPSTAGQGRA